MIFTRNYLNEVQEIAKQLDEEQILKAVDILANLQGRLFILGVGGSAANASHAVNDFRKIAGIEAYAPTDNVAELTARTNDDGWETVFSNWLKVSKLNSQDALLVLSVGGGSATTSKNLVEAMQLAKTEKAKIISIVGRDGGYAGRLSDACILIPNVYPDHVTPLVESFQAVVWHLIVNHPKLKSKRNKAVFLDRDGTLIRLIYNRPPLKIDEVSIFPDALPALKRLKDAGFKLIVVTNQPDVSRGLVKKEWVEQVNTVINDNLPIDHFYICYHSDEDKCGCRKPKPELLLLAARNHNIDMKKSYMIGDTWKDVEAGTAAGCKTYWLHDRSHETRATSLTEVVNQILESK